MPRVRVHQHVNPFAPHYQQEPEPIDLAAVFARPEFPLHLDIGCARGRFILRMAEAERNWNFLGLEIRVPLVAEANQIASEKTLTNLHYEFCNAMTRLDRLMEDLPNDILRMVTIQFPDPWFKRKHAKRRMVNEELAAAVVNNLASSGHIFIQTDIEFLAEEMKQVFITNNDLRGRSISKNPFSVRTEREKAVETKGLPVYRMLFEKK
jgi:tRNA (guanine-N7-)-methyltransferase